MKNHMPASGRFLRPINRRLLLKAAAALTGVAAVGRVPAALAAMFDDVKDQYLNAGVDWRQAEGSSIQLAGLTHPWMETIRPLVPIFEELTGVTVEVLEQSNTEFIAEMPVKLAAENSSPDVYMVWAQGQAISGGWLEPLTPYLADSSLHDAAWWDDDDNFPGARSFAVWSDGESYTRTITAEAQTLFVNRSILEANGVSIPDTFDGLRMAAAAINSDDVSGIAMRGKATGDAVAWPAGGYVFSYGGGILDLDGNVAMDSPEAVEAVDMYARTLREGGPIGVANYHWLESLSDFLQGATAFGCDSSNFATDISNPEKEHGCRCRDLRGVPEIPFRGLQAEHVALAHRHQPVLREQEGRMAVPDVGDFKADQHARGGRRTCDAEGIGLVFRCVQGRVRRGGRGSRARQSGQHGWRHHESDLVPPAGGPSARRVRGGGQRSDHGGEGRGIRARRCRRDRPPGLGAVTARRISRAPRRAAPALFIPESAVCGPCV